MEYIDGADGVVQHAQFTHVIHATGLCSSKPHVPEFDGLETFTGRLLHSAQREDDLEEFAGAPLFSGFYDACAMASRNGMEHVSWWGGVGVFRDYSDLILSSMACYTAYV